MSSEDLTPAPPADRAPAAGPDVMLWLGVLVIVCALIVLVLQRRRLAAGSSAPATRTPSTPAPIAQADGYAEVEDLALDREIAALAGQAAVELSTEGAIAGDVVHSHKRLRRHPELRSAIDADV